MAGRDDGGQETSNRVKQSVLPPTQRDIKHGACIVGACLERCLFPQLARIAETKSLYDPSSASRVLLKVRAPAVDRSTGRGLQGWRGRWT